MTEEQRIETEEAIAAADVALYHLGAAKKYLKSAGNWGIYDMIGGGFLSGLIKHGKIESAEEEIAAAKEALESFAEELKDVTGYSSVTSEASSIKVEGADAKYALLPVWILNTTYNGTKYTFAMNGQTGKFIGDLPIDKGKVRLFMLKRAIIWTVILTVLFAIFI